MLLPNDELDDYALSEKGKALTAAAIDVCVRHGLRWKDLWSSSTAKAQAARDALDLNLPSFSSPELSGMIMGAHAFTETLRGIALGKAELTESVAKLRDVGLVGFDNIFFASEQLGVDIDDILVLLIPIE